MQVPSYWAEVTERGRLGQRWVTVRRCGWSDTSEAAALAHAGERARAALAAALAGERVPSREVRTPYGSEDGLPIREEVVERRSDAVITRNVYGARCLNSPDVLFADVDYAGLGQRRSLLPWLVLGGALLLASWWVGSWLAVISLGFIGLGIGRWVLGVRPPAAERGLDLVRNAAAAWLDEHPSWVLRVYRTPAGVRLAALHRTFAPQEPEVGAFFAAMHVDPLYARMCRAQRCFRARLGPKPWRIGITERLRPRSGVWPITDPEILTWRAAWVTRYEARARGFAACAFVEELGDGFADPRAARLLEWHDAEARALESLPLA